MDESNGTPFTMPVAPMYGNGGFGNSFGGDWAWIILLLVLCGGWGNGFGGGYGGGLGYDFPWLLNGQNGINNNVSDGFRDAQLHDSVTSVRDGIGNLTTQLCNCCGDMQMSIANAQSALSTQLCNNEISSLNRSFAEQTANTAGFTAVNTGIADLKYTIASEACADRAAVQQGIQTVIDKLCALELDSAKREAADLRTQLNMANLAASQTRQTADIQNSIINELRSCPIPAQPVYGSQPIFTCGGNNSGCCGCGGF